MKFFFKFGKQSFTSTGKYFSLIRLIGLINLIYKIKFCLAKNPIVPKSNRKVPTADEVLNLKSGWCNRKLLPGKMIPPVTFMPQHLKTISLSNLSFCRKMLLNCLHFLLKFENWILFYKKVLVDFILYL